MMPTDRESAREDLDFLEALKESSLNDYPNPERVDCPEREFLRTLVGNRRSILKDDPRRKHVIYCSSCFQDFTTLRQRARFQTQIKVVTGIAAIILVAVGPAWMWRQSPRTGPKTTQIAATNVSTNPILAEISLENRSVARGDASPQHDNAALHVPRGHLKLTILLPFSSPDGTYDIQLLKEVDKPLMNQSGHAILVDGITKLTVDLDTSSLAGGKYLLGVRYAQLDWSFNTVTVD
jgi:hypothetical protein